MYYASNMFDVSSILMWFSPEAWMLIQCYILVSYGVIKLASTDEYFLPKMHILAISVVLTTMYLVYNSIESYNEVIDRNAHDTLIELFVLSITLSVFVFTYNYNKSTGLLSFEYYVVMLICTFSFCTFIHASDIMLMYVLVELQSICSYVLTAINRNNRFAVEAGIKYFIIGSLSSILLLLGFSFLYGFPGLIGISDLATYLRFVYAMNDYFFTYTMVMSLIFVNVGFLFKIYSAPFHFWVADIYQGAPTSVTVYLATIPVVSYVYVFVKWYVCIFSELTTFYSYILYVLSMLSISSGVFGALVQRRIKRLIAYSSISTIGYILAGVSGDSIVLTQQCLMYPLIYITNILSIFVVMLNYRFADGQCMDNIRHLSGLYTQNAFAFTAFSIALFSLAGIPPLSGFVSKLLLFTSLSTESMFSLLIFSIIFTLIGSYYYVRIIKMLFYDRVPCTYFYSNPSYNVIWFIASLSLLNIAFIFTHSWFDNVLLYIVISLYS